jgi:dihydroflavonol-4-reductase
MDAASELEAVGAETIVGDIVDRETTRRAAAGVGAVFHLAGRLFAPGVPAHEYERLHVDATKALLEACAPESIEYFVFCSTTGVFGRTGTRPAVEDDPVNPSNAYERTKAEAERAASAMAKAQGIKLAIARPGLVYGPGDRHLLGWYRAIRGGYYRVIGSGTNRLHPIYIDDAVRGLVMCASGATTVGRPYHLVGPRPVTMIELSEAIGIAVGRPVARMHLPAPLAFLIGTAFEALPVPRRTLPLSRSRVRFMLDSREYDGTRARDELGFSPRVELAEGMARTVSWYRANGWL